MKTLLIPVLALGRQALPDASLEVPAELAQQARQVVRQSVSDVAVGFRGAFDHPVSCRPVSWCRRGCRRKNNVRKNAYVPCQPVWDPVAGYDLADLLLFVIPTGLARLAGHHLLFVALHQR